MPGIQVNTGRNLDSRNILFRSKSVYYSESTGIKNLREAQRGMVFAGYLKLLIPVLVVIPGIAAFYLKADIGKA